MDLADSVNPLIFSKVELTSPKSVASWVELLVLFRVEIDLLIGSFADILAEFLREERLISVGEITSSLIS